MPEPAVVTAMREFKRGLLQREAGQMQAMARRWLGVETALSAEIEALTFDFDQRRRDGETISRAALYRQERYKRLLVQTNEQFAQYAGWAEGQVRDGQQTMGRLGLEHGAQAIEMSYWDGQTVAPVFDRLPVEAIERMVGIAGNGAPLGELLKQRIAPGYGDGQAASVWQRLTQTLVDSTALGRNPRKTARLMRDALAGGLNKALVIARTEQLRVYRQASVDQYRASGVVRGQKRLTAHDDRVCAACIADEGTVYSLEATIPDHPQGRCTSVPIVDGMPEISWLSGEAWFRTQPEGVQRSILGPGKLAAWQDGQFDFGALATPTYDDTWGGGLRPTSLADLVRGTGSAPLVSLLPPPAGMTKAEAKEWLASIESLNPALTPEESAALEWYKGDGYYDINDDLREAGYSEDDRAALIEQAIARGQLDRPVTLFRGSDWDVFDEDDLTGSIIEDAAFVSTSLVEKVAEAHAQEIILEIRVPVGARALNMERWGVEGWLDGEGEILLQRDARFRVVSDNIDNDPDVRRLILELLL